MLVHSPMSREVWGGFWSFAGWPRDGDMRRWEVNPRHSFMNLPRAFVSSTIEGPRLPKWHLKVTKSHFSCQSLFIEPQDKGQRGAGFLFFLSICSCVHYHTCLGLNLTLFFLIITKCVKLRLKNLSLLSTLKTAGSPYQISLFYVYRSSLTACLDAQN